MEIKPVLFRTKDHVNSRQRGHTPDKAVKLPTNATLEQKVIAAIQTIYDPEIHINVYDLGLIYHININDNSVVKVEMTLTAPACPVAEILPVQVAEAIRSVEGVHDAKVSLVWEPPWNQQCITEAARLELGLL